MSIQTAIAVGGLERKNGAIPVQAEAGSAFNTWLRDFKTPNADNHGRRQPSDLSILSGRALRLRGAVPLSGPIQVEVPAISYAKEEGEIVTVVKDESRIARVEIIPVGSGLGRDVQLALVIRRPEDDYKVEPTQKERFDPLTAAQQSRRALRVEIVPLEGRGSDVASQLIGETALAKLDDQVVTIDRQVRTYLAASI